MASALCQADEVYKEARIPLVVTYDSDADAAYIYLEHPVTSGASERIVTFDPREGMFNLDIDRDAHVLGLEILGARQHLPSALLEAILSQGQVETEHPQ
jgi:uncharacterized protein YuzE